MVVYAEGVMALNFAVDLLLLLAANRLSGFPNRWKRLLWAAAAGGIYGGICLLPRLAFLGNFLWRTVMLAAMSVMAFGMTRSGLKRGVVFVLLSMALGGVALGLEGGAFRLIVAAGVLCLLCGVGLPKPLGGAQYVPVELTLGDTNLRLTALRDTGNTLRDPITGRPVLVVAPKVAGRLTGLTPEQLGTPLQTLGQLPGLRLIPYRALGQAGGFLLAMRLPKMQVGDWKGSGLVAFAPTELSPDGAYEALTGGNR